MIGSETYDQLYEEITQGLDIEEAIKRMSKLPIIQENEMVKETISDRIVKIVSELLLVNEKEIYVDLEFSQMGFDEVIKEKFLSKINQTFDLHIQENEFSVFKSLQDIIHIVKSKVAEESIDNIAVESKEIWKEQMVDYLKKQLGKLIKLDPYRINEEALIEKYGVDSIVMLDWIEILGETFGPLQKTLMFEYQTIQQLADYFIDEYKDKVGSLLGIKTVTVNPAIIMQKKMETMTENPAQTIEENSTQTILEDIKEKYTEKEKSKYMISNCKEVDNDEIAIIGMSGRFPKSNSVQQLFEHLLEGKDLVTAVDNKRWDSNQYRDIIRCDWGGFVDDVDKFDSTLFEILPMEANVIDPMSRLFLESVYTLMESSGYTKSMLAKKYDKKVGVYVGAMYQQYQLERADIEQESFTCVNSFSSIANRVSYYYDFQGPSVAIDTMCSSSSVAIHMACESLRNKECKLAIAGGVNLSIHPKKYIGLTKSGVIASSKESRSFAEGDGYIPCEGIGSILLKPLKQAVIDGDDIVAVIKTTSVNHNGHTNGYMVPSQVTQRKLMEESFEKCNISPDTISYVEAAANGSPLGDSIEMDALIKFFESKTDKRQYCAVGAVKSNMGHPEAVSGIAQIAKVAMQLKNKVMVPSIYLEHTNPNIHLEDSPFYFVNEKRTWEQPFEIVEGIKKEYPRRAVIDSIGAGGTNVNIILEEYITEWKEEIPNTKLSSLFLFSAASKEQLQEVAKQMIVYLHKNSRVSLPRLAYTLQTRKEIMDVKMAIISESVEDLLWKLEQAIESFSKTEKPCCDGVYMTANEQEIMLLQHLLKGRIKDKFVNLIIEGESLDKMALFWVNGSDVSFHSFYDKTYRPILDLPTYPFKKERYWVGKRIDETVKREEMEEEPDTVSGEVIVNVKQLISNYSGLNISDLSEGKTLEQYGFNSIQLFNLKSELEKTFHVEVPITLLNGKNTIGDIIAYLADCENKEQQQESLLPVVTKRNQDQYLEFPLNDIQESFYIGRKAKFGGDLVGAHIYFEFEVKDLNIKKLNETWNQLVKYHTCLHTKITSQGKQIVVEEVSDYQFRILDLQRDKEDRIKRQLESIRTKLSHKIYSPEEEIYYEIRISLLPRKEAVVHFSIDELIVDATSIQILLQQWKELYEGRINQLPEINITFRDYVYAIKDFEKSIRYKHDLSYWLERLENMPNGPLLPRNMNTSDQAASIRKRYQYRFSKEKWNVLKEKAREYKVSTTVLMLTLFEQFLKESTQQREFSLLLTYYNRLPIHEDIEAMVGPLISTNIFVVEDGVSKLEDKVIRNQEMLFQDLDHNTVSGIRILRELKQQKKMPKDLYLPVVFTSLINNFTNEEKKNKKTFFTDINYMVTQTPQVYLDHQLYEESDQLVISWDIAYQYFGEKRAEELFNSYCNLINQYIGLDNSLPYPLTDMQYAYAYGRNTEVKSIANCQFYQEIDFDNFDLQWFRFAWNSLIKRHPMLRTRIRDNGTQQTMNSVEDYVPKIYDLSELTDEEREKKLQDIKNKMSREAFTINSWPFFCVEIAVMKQKKARVFLTIDMLIADGFSIQNLLEQLITTYEKKEAMVPLTYTFEEYIKTMKENKDNGAKDKEYWEEKFTNLNSGPILHDVKLRDNGNELSRKHKKATISGWRYLKKEAEKRMVSKSSVLFTIYAEVIAHFMGDNSFTLVVPSWERPRLHTDINDVIGDFTRMSWIPVNPQDNKSFVEKLRTYDQIQQEDLSHKPTEAFKVLRKIALQKKKKLEFPVVFTDMFPKSEFQLPDTITMGSKISNTPSVYLDNISQEDGNELIIQWDGVFELFEEGIVDQMFDGYHKILKVLCSQNSNWDELQIEAILSKEIDIVEQNNSTK